MNQRRSGFTLIELLVVIVIITMMISLLLPAVQSARESARRTACVNNLVQIGIALQSYETTHTVLPPGAVDAIGPILELPTSYQFSWIAQILPHLEQKAVYRNFNFNVGVYQPANETARGVKLNVLSCSSSRSFSGTSYAACQHDVEAPIDVNNHGVFFLNSHVKLDEIEDGLSHTIFVGEKQAGSGDELGWASGTRSTLRNTGTPINLTNLVAINYSPALMGLLEGTNPTMPGGEGPPLRDDEIPPEARRQRQIPAMVGGFGSFHGPGSNFLFGDGSVRYVKTQVNGKIYRLLGARNDGQIFGDDQF